MCYLLLLYNSTLFVDFKNILINIAKYVKFHSHSGFKRHKHVTFIKSIEVNWTTNLVTLIKERMNIHYKIMYPLIKSFKLFITYFKNVYVVVCSPNDKKQFFPKQKTSSSVLPSGNRTKFKSPQSPDPASRVL